MSSHFDESPTTSDQEELVGASGGSDLDDDATDVDEMQFTYCKNHSTTTANDNNNDTDAHTHLIENCVTKLETKSKMALFGIGLLLLLSTFLLLLIYPLYQMQLELGGSSHNAYGALLFYSIVVTLLLVLGTIFTSWIYKWNVKFYEFPIPGKRLFIISSLCGIAGTLLTISSYRRVPCHLQDPLKGAALVYSLIFYFFFCRKVMGLQRIFSATTAVVGLFISVDYGLCDEFRCRGSEITNTTDKPTNGWQSRAVWTLFYVIGIGLWVLHLSLLEGHVVTMPGSIKHNFQSNGFLTTISRLVARNEPQIVERTTPRPKKYKPKPLHLATWVHVLAFLFIISVGWIDMIPNTKEAQTFSHFWKSTQKTFWCHISIEKKMSDFQKHQATLEFLSNLSPYSVIYNQTVQKLRRNKRDVIENHAFNHSKINTSVKVDTAASAVTNFSVAGSTERPLTTHTNHSTLKKTHPFSSVYATNLSNSTISQQKLHRINTNKDWEKLRENLRQKLLSKNMNYPSEIKIAHLVMSSPQPGEDECGGDGDQLKQYVWMLIFTYITFCVALFNFLVLSESAVFTITIITASLPLIGIFWSLFEMTTTTDHIATIIWSPEITGELICSLLGTPIVFLGLSLLCRAHFRDGSSSLILPTRNYYSTLTSSSTTATPTNNVMA